MKECTRDDCNRKALAKGLCTSHYQAERMSAIRSGVRALHPPCAHCGADMAGAIPSKRFCSPRCKADHFIAVDKAERLAARTDRKCLNCERVFTPESSAGKARTCSRSCSVTWHNRVRAERAQARWEAAKKPCPVCGADLPDDRKAGSVYCSPECKKKEMDARWRARSPGYNRQYLYGVTPDQTAAMLAAQANRCAICGTEAGIGKNGLHLDHDHTTGKVRALLCGPCNNGLGLFKDDPARLRAAAAYLEAHTV